MQQPSASSARFSGADMQLASFRLRVVLINEQPLMIFSPFLLAHPREYMILLNIPFTVWSTALTLSGLRLSFRVHSSLCVCVVLRFFVALLLRLLCLIFFNLNPGFVVESTNALDELHGLPPLGPHLELNRGER